MINPNVSDTNIGRCVCVGDMALVIGGRCRDDAQWSTPRAALLLLPLAPFLVSGAKKTSRPIIINVVLPISPRTERHDETIRNLLGLSGARFEHLGDHAMWLRFREPAGLGD